MNDNKPETERPPEAGKAQAASERLTPPAMEQQRRVDAVKREAKESDAGANDPQEVVNQEG